MLKFVNFRNLALLIIAIILVVGIVLHSVVLTAIGVVSLYLFIIAIFLSYNKKIVKNKERQ